MTTPEERRCIFCGATEYEPSLGGPNVCPACDCGRFPASVAMENARLNKERAAILAEVERLRGLIDSPELHDFARGVVLEAAHQRERWAADHDGGKAPEDWFWLLGYLGGKALHAAKTGDVEKALHHTISTAAALANWHAALTGASTDMRPGIDPQERGYEHS